MRTKTKTSLLWVGLIVILSLVPVLTAAQQAQDLITGRIDDDTPYVEIPITVEEAQAGSTIVVDIQPVEGEAGGDLDTLLYLVDGDGTIIAENDDRSRQIYSSRIEFPQADDGFYTAIATRYGVIGGSSSGDFELFVEINEATIVSAPSYAVSPEALEAAGFPEVNRDPAEWTIMAYYGGDNNLEPSVMFDFNEFELAGGSTDDVRVIMLLDRSDEFTETSGNWVTTQLFEISNDVSGDESSTYPPTLDSEKLADLGERNTGSGETFAQFLVWAVRNYPAENYAIALASHGAGWEGIITDEHADYAILSIPELKESFRLATQEIGGNQFALLINDACLMSSVEYFAGINPYFELSIASPEIVIDPALDMTLFTGRLKEQLADTDLNKLTANLVDTYIERDIIASGSADAVYFTSAVTDLDNFDPVVAAVEEFAAVFNENPYTHSSVLGDARSNTWTYTEFAGDTTLIDLGSLMQEILRLSRDGDLIAAADTVINALTDARLHSDGGELAKARVSYYNIYFPANSAFFKSDYFVESPLVEWARMLRNYYNVVTPQPWISTAGGIQFHAPIAPKIAITSIYPETASVISPPNMGVEIVGQNISHADFTVDQMQADGSAIRLSSERFLWDIVVDDELRRMNLWHGVDVLQYWWDATQPFITDGNAANFELLVFTESVAFLDGYYIEPGGETWRDVSVVFDHDGNVQRIISRTTDSGAVAVVNIPAGSTFVAFRSVVNPDGGVTQELGNYYVWPENGLTWTWEPVPSGQYNLGFLVMAFGGTTGFDSRKTIIENDASILSLRGDTRKDLGFTVVRPADWQRLAFFSDDFFLRTQNEDETNNTTVYLLFPDVTVDSVSNENLEAATIQAMEIYERQIDGALTPTMVDGEDVFEFSFSYVTEAGVINGRAFSHFTPGTGVGEVFAAEVLEGTGDLDAQYQQLKDTFTFFDAAALRDTGTVSWTHIPPTNFNPAYQYPVPVSWLVDGEIKGDMGGTQDGIWWRYAPMENPTGPTMAAIASELPAEGNTASQMMDSLLSDYVTAYEMVSTRPFSNDNSLIWETTTFTTTRNGESLVGRMYITVVDDLAYAVWVETSNANIDIAAATFADTFELIVNGFQFR